MIIMPSGCPAVFLALFFASSAASPLPASDDPGSAPAPAGKADSLFSSGNLLAWCIVPFDSRRRTPAERIAMLKRLGFTQYVWDWRQEHLKDLPGEIRLARENGIRLRGVWLWIDGDWDKVGALSEGNRTVIDAIDQAEFPAEFWVGFHPNYFDALADAARVRKGAEMVAYLRDLAVASGSTVALYNHGDWFGEPENQIRLIEAVGDPSVGMVYNFHHAHDQLDRYPELLPRMLPRLRAVNLNGMRAEGPKILPIGEGTHEREMIRLLLEAGYNGPLGILGHVEDADVEVVLKRNLAGLRSIAGVGHE